jgi:hypothetical protein
MHSKEREPQVQIVMSGQAAHVMSFLGNLDADDDVLKQVKLLTWVHYPSMRGCDEYQFPVIEKNNYLHAELALEQLWRQRAITYTQLSSLKNLIDQAKLLTNFAAN